MAGCENGKENKFLFSVTKSEQEMMVVVVGDKRRVKCWNPLPAASL